MKCSKFSNRTVVELDGELPELVTAEEYTGWKGQFETVVGRHPKSIIVRTTDTLRHYEAKMERLKNVEGDWVEMMMARDELEFILAREAPFSALGRYMAGSTATFGKVYNELFATACAALAAESGPEWFEGPSGKVYQVSGQVLWTPDGDGKSQWANTIPVEDAAFVAKLMEAKND